MLKNILKILIIFIIGAVGGIFADQIFWPYFVERPLFHQYRLEQSPIYLTEKKKIYIQENVALKDAIEKVEKTAVGIKGKTKAGKALEGTGLILTSDGLVITLASLVPQGGTFNLIWEGKIFTAQVLKKDLKENLALIDLAGEKYLPTTSFADFEKLKLGERIFLLGIIFEKEEVKKLVNEGIVKGLDENSIQTNIIEKSALSGSPLFDIEGNILGLSLIGKDGNVSAIPISKIRSFTGL